MQKAPILYCRCKMCGSTYLDSLPSDRRTADVSRIGTIASTITTTHNCSKGDNPLCNAYGVGEILGVIYR